MVNDEIELSDIINKIPKTHLENPVETIKDSYFKIANEYNGMHPIAKIATWPLAIATICLTLYAGSAFMNAKSPIKRPTIFEQGAPITPRSEQTQEKKQDLNIKINFNVPYNR
ncbi:hypothetical protein COV11_00650 [Candidatus Woesearchaeota archaeon CG10_big_fil_rev_8_21_14_0_10_30_7]|nr:MAG: hypothetical protein COV11_00650 [Candidatus Woesearchaeota archaeon CG10_big_fil_rev_8_21_14_0_10_30_7]